MVTREVIADQVRLWSEMPEDERGDLDDFIRSFLEENIPPSERKIQRGGEYIDAIDYIMGDLEHYG